MLRRLSLLPAAILALFALSPTAAAQVRPVPNTGCPNAPYPTTTGNPAIGQGFGIIAAPCRTLLGQPFIVLGVPGLSAVVPMPPACEARCVLECRPLIVLPQASFRTIIPNDRTLVGGTLCSQTGCVESGRPAACIYLHGALGITITP